MIKHEDLNDLLIIAGSDNYPKILLEAARKSGIKNIHVIAFKGETKKRNLNLADSISWIKVGEFQKMLNILTQLDFKYGMMVGQISPKNIFSMKLDDKAKNLLSSLSILNTHTIFKKIVNEIESTGIKMLPANYFINECIPNAGVLTKRDATKDEYENIKIGTNFIKSNSNFDVGQTVVMKSGYIVAVEAMEGTNKTILRAKALAGKNLTVVKVPKINHDFRFDIPVVGIKTIHSLIKAKATCLSIEANSTIVLNLDKVLELANKHNIAIVSLETNT